MREIRILKKMSRALLLVIGISFIGFGLSAGDRPQPSFAQSSPPPNMIFILTDDLDAESIAHMPKLQRLLVEQGIRFDNAFVTMPLCCPSRATTLRGQYTHNHTVVGNEPPKGGEPRFREMGLDKSTIATWLDGVGYETGYFGRYLHHYDDGTYVPPGWDEWHAWTTFNGSEMSENGAVATYDPKLNYHTDVLSDKAAEFIRHASGQDKPFFAHIGTRGPHKPAGPAPRHEGAFADEPLPKAPNFNEEDVSDKPQWVQDEQLLGPEEIASVEDLYRNRLESMLAIDDMIERLLITLQETGELDNTYIVLTSDNGFSQGHHRRAFLKQSAYEEDIRVPLVVRGPGVPAAQTREHLVLNNDLAPTFAQLGGAQAPSFVDGRSLVNLLGSAPLPPSEWRSMFLVGKYHSKVLPAYTAVRTLDHKYVKYTYTGERELYALRSDPYELQNLANTADPSLISQLNYRLGALDSCAGAECRHAENIPPDVILPDSIPPSTTAKISPEPNGAGWNRAGVSVKLDAVDDEGGSGVKEIAYSAAGAQSVEATTAPGSSTQLSITSEGATTLSYSSTDNTGNAETQKTLAVKVDTLAPSGTVLIDGGAASTNTCTVSLTLSASDPDLGSGVAKMRFRNKGTTTWSPWEPYATSKRWTLSKGAGRKVVQTQYRDLAGNISAIAMDAIKCSP